MWRATAPKLVRGFELVQTYGCFGCHEIQGFRGTDPIGPDMRLEPQTAEEAKRVAEDPNQIAGKMRKVGPSLRHLASKAEHLVDLDSGKRSGAEVMSAGKSNTALPEERCTKPRLIVTLPKGL